MSEIKAPLLSIHISVYLIFYLFSPPYRQDGDLRRLDQVAGALVRIDGPQQLGPLLLTAAGAAEAGARGQTVYSVQMMLMRTQPRQRPERREIRKSRKPERHRHRDTHTLIAILRVYFTKKTKVQKTRNEASQIQ